MPHPKDAGPMVPMAVKLSLEPLLAFWETLPLDPAILDVKALVSRFRGREPSDFFLSPADSEERRHLELLLSPLVPPAFLQRTMAAVIAPFTFSPLWCTPRFEVLTAMKPEEEERSQPQLLAYAYSLILEKLYGMKVPVDIRPVFSFFDIESGFTRYAQMSMAVDFVTVKAVGKLPRLTEEQKSRILADPTQVDTLLEMLPPAHFLFEGLILLQAQDVTEPKLVSSIKDDLLDNQAVFSQEGIRSLEAKMSSLLEKKSLFLKLAAFRGDEITVMHAVDETEDNCWLVEGQRFSRKDYAAEIFARVVDTMKPIWVHDLLAQPNHSVVETEMVQYGIRSLLAVPLVIEGTALGVLTLTSREPGALGVREGECIRELVPLFALALNRNLEDFDARIQKVIQEKYTSIHPSVAWKFRKAAQTILEKRKAGDREDEPLVFEGVFPLYSASDIRNSSVTRNTAITQDLQDHLNLALGVLGTARKAKDLPILEELEFRIGGYLRTMAEGLSSGDEITVLQFLREEVESAFLDLRTLGPEVETALTGYHAALDPVGHFVYRRRKDFDETVARINADISQLLEEEQGWAQEMFPHYFDKTSTDGVDFNMYLGASLAEGRHFDRLYLRNLRLWQFIMMTRIARLTRNLKPQLPIPLDTTHLIVVQDMPITIRFREDEKRFIVEGAYNTRYEIMKKRIDKATVKGTGERLTLVDQIAIVYSQPSEALEYRRYIQFLQAKGLLQEGVEELELEDLQGIHGLRALRVAVKMGASTAMTSTALSDLVVQGVKAS